MKLTKIDIFKKEEIILNDEDNNKFTKIDKDSFNTSEFLNEFSDIEDLLTINIDNPLKRIIRFYDINNSIPSNFIEVTWESMSEEQKMILDRFISESSDIFQQIINQ